MAIVIVGHETAAATGALTIDVPAGAQNGDMLVLLWRNQTQLSTTYPEHGDFTRITPYEASSGAGRVSGIAYHAITNAGAEPDNYTFTVPSGSGWRAVGALVLLRGVDLVNPVVDVVESYTGDVSTLGYVTVESLNSTVEDGLLLCFTACVATEGFSHVPTELPSGITHLVSAETASGTVGSREHIWIGYKEVEGPAGTITWRMSSGIGSRSGQAAIFRPSGAIERLATPVVTLGATTPPTAPSASDGQQVVTWPAVPGAAGYSAHISTVTSNPEDSDFTLVAATVTSPYVFTGLAPGLYAFGIRAKAS